MFCFITRNKKKLEKVREKLKDTSIAEDKEKTEKLKQELLQLEKKVQNLHVKLIVLN